MSLPSTVYALADLYQRPFFSSKSWSETMLPSFSPPNNKPPFFIALLGNHIMALELNKLFLFPAPQLAAEWTRYASQEALAWKDKYDDCLIKLTQELKNNIRSNRMVYWLMFFFYFSGNFCCLPCFSFSTSSCYKM
jgi:hypothetical protein